MLRFTLAPLAHLHLHILAQPGPVSAFPTEWSEGWLVLFLFSGVLAMPASRRARQPSTLELLLGRRSNDSGVTELAGVAVLWLGGSVVLLRKSSLFAALFNYQHGGSRWQRAAMRYPMLVLLHCLSIFITGCLQQRVTIKWTQNIARKLHRLLFQKQNFHRLHPETKDSIISEADLNVCRDIYDMARATSEVAVALIEAGMLEVDGCRFITMLKLPCFGVFGVVWFLTFFLGWEDSYL